MKKLFSLLILLFVFAACKKKAEIDAVDKIVGSYFGTAHIKVSESYQPRYGTGYGTGFNKYLDTTYQTTVIIKKVAPDSFLAVTDIEHIHPFNQSTFYNFGTYYKGYDVELSFDGDRSLSLHVNHRRGYTSGASGFYNYSYGCDFSGIR